MKYKNVLILTLAAFSSLDQASDLSEKQSRLLSDLNEAGFVFTSITG